MLQNEELATFGDLARLLPKANGRRFNQSTLWRWALRGNRGVRLECLRLGGRFYSSLAAIHRFGEACAERASADLAAREAERATKAKSVVPPTVSKPTPAIRRAQIAQANRILDEAGIR